MRKATKQFNLRLDIETHSWVKAEAEKNRRAINSQINKWIADAKNNSESKKEAA